ncbi:hypothetical protein SK128_000234, partial [Halocaridina rubra]
MRKADEEKIVRARKGGDVGGGGVRDIGRKEGRDVGGGGRDIGDVRGRGDDGEDVVGGRDVEDVRGRRGRGNCNKSKKWHGESDGEDVGVEKGGGGGRYVEGGRGD